MSELIKFDPKKITVFDEFYGELEEVKNLNEKTIFDYDSRKGNKEARSHINKLRQTKSAIEKARKKAKSESLEYGRSVDQKAKSLSIEVEEMINVHAKPLKEIEERENQRIAKHQASIDSLEEYKAVGSGAESRVYKGLLSDVKRFEIGEHLEEFLAEAAKTKDESLRCLETLLQDSLRREAEQEELERLRAEAQERKAKENEERIAREASEKAKKQAEEKARQLELQRIKEDTERKQKAQNEIRKKQIEVEIAKREKAEAEERAAKAEIAAKIKAEEDHKREVERKRVEAEKREKNKRHRAKINNQCREDLVKIGLTEGQAKEVIICIAKSQVRNITVNY